MFFVLCVLYAGLVDKRYLVASLPAYTGSFTMEKLNKIKSILKYFQVQNFKPIKGDKYKELLNSQIAE